MKLEGRNIDIVETWTQWSLCERGEGMGVTWRVGRRVGVVRDHVMDYRAER